MIEALEGPLGKRSEAVALCWSAERERWWTEGREEKRILERMRGIVVVGRE